MEAANEFERKRLETILLIRKIMGIFSMLLAFAAFAILISPSGTFNRKSEIEFLFSGVSLFAAILSALLFIAPEKTFNYISRRRNFYRLISGQSAERYDPELDAVRVNTYMALYLAIAIISFIIALVS